MEWASVALTVVGFALTIWQVARAGGAARAARDAAESVSARLGDLLLYSLIPQLRVAEADLRFARGREDHDLAIRAIVKWREVMTEVAGHLAARGLAAHADDELIAACSGLANTSEDLLVERTTTVHEAVARLLHEVGHLSARLGEISARLVTEAPHVRTR